MAEETPRLTLGFVGAAEVHRANSLALLKDLVGAFLKQHRKAEVLIVLENVPKSEATDTMSDLADWAETSGHGLTYAVANEMVTVLLAEDDARLILVGDPNEDDVVYAVAEEAAQYKIQTRSLINGLEKVVFDDDDLDPDELSDGFHEVDLDDPDDDLLDDDMVTDEVAPDLDVLADLADGGETEAQEEIKNIASAMGIDTAPFETWADAVLAIRGGQRDDVEEGYFDADAEDPAPEVPSPAVEVAEPDMSEQEASASAEVPGSDEESEDTVAGKTYTREQLEAKTFDEVKALGLDYGIAPGRGMKHGVYVNKILQATGVETDAPKPKVKKEKLTVVAPPPADNAADATVTQLVPKPDNFDVLIAVAAALRKVANELDPQV